MFEENLTGKGMSWREMLLACAAAVGMAGLYEHDYGTGDADKYLLLAFLFINGLWMRLLYRDVRESFRRYRLTRLSWIVSLVVYAVAVVFALGWVLRPE